VSLYFLKFSKQNSLIERLSLKNHWRKLFCQEIFVNCFSKNAPMLKAILLSGILLGFVLSGFPMKGTTVETERMIIRDVTGNIPRKKFEKFVTLVDSTLSSVIRFWSADPRIKESGKIIIEFDQPLQKNIAASYFFFRKENGQNFRVVKVYGGDDHPQQLAHKLTSALFPNPDIMIRNMMGEASEIRFGNPLSFPMCGFNKDEWVMAIQQAGSYIPLAEMGSGQGDWGKEIVGNVPVVTDRVKEHTLYLEAGSFGEYLIHRYGIGKMKQFYRLSKNKSRPWEEIYGTTLEQLEVNWLGFLKATCRDKMDNISTLAELWKKNPNNACFMAQDLAD
jgi:hypothetical protein